MDNKSKSMEAIVTLCKARGFVYPGSEIYGGLANTWDYGPLGSQMKKNIKDLWWKDFVEVRDDMVGLDSSIILNPKVWEASGHVANFADPMLDCKSCKARFRADHFIEEATGLDVDGKGVAELQQIMNEKDLACSKCGKKDFTEVRTFNQLFETRVGALAGDAGKVYLRGETAQGIFIDFKNILNSTRKKLPFGVGQMGKSFRNEITPGNFTFRTLEFEQAEIEYFFDPEKSNWEEIFESWKASMMDWLTNKLGLKLENIFVHEIAKADLAFYSKRTIDIEYKFPFGGDFEELWGMAYRTDYDLTQHQKFSGESLEVFDQEANRKFIPHVIEPAVGLDRLFLAALVEAYDEEEVEGEKRTILRFNHRIAPVQVAVLPLSKKEELTVVAEPLMKDLKKYFRVEYDETQSIGKRYRRQDEIGTPFCITVDFDSLNDKQVTVRERDSMKQERIPIENLINYLREKIS